MINTQYERMRHPIREAEILNEYSPALHADKIEIPILLIVGEADKRVSVKQSKLMANALEDEDKSFEFVKIKGAGHNIFRYYEHAEKVYNKIEKFLAAHLQ